MQVALFVFSHLVRKLRVHKCSLLLFYLRLHLHKGSTTREGTLGGTSGGWATLFILDSMKLKDISEMYSILVNWKRKRKGRCCCYL